MLCSLHYNTDFDHQTGFLSFENGFLWNIYDDKTDEYLGATAIDNRRFFLRLANYPSAIQTRRKLMMAIAVIGALFLYVWLSFGVVWLVVRWAKKRGRSPIRWGIVAGLVMYHLVFWDFLPTFIVYKYYCTTKAGFWVYKTPEQWKEENPGVAETLTWKERSETFKSPDITLGYNINQRLIWIIRKKSTNLVPVGINEQEIVDLETHEVLAKIIGVSTGHSGEKITRFWTHFGPCFDGSKEFSLLVTKYKQIGREEK